jgi:hypothetical protein
MSDITVLYMVYLKPQLNLSNVRLNRKYNLKNQVAYERSLLVQGSASSISDPLLDEFDECITQFTSFMHLNVQSLVPKIDFDDDESSDEES